MEKADTSDGLFGLTYSDLGKMLDSRYTVGGEADSFYEYLLKSWLQSNRINEQARKMYRSASAALKKRLVLKSKSGLTYVGEIIFGAPITRMEHLACFAVGMFALEAQYENRPEQKNNTMNLATELARTCRESYIRSPTRLGPEIFHFQDDFDAVSRDNGTSYYNLRPEAIEAFFYMWRFTGNETYCVWVWDAVQAIDVHCRQPHGSAGLKNVYDNDNQETFFLAETLKYAFLTFAPSSMLPFNRWVFNTEGHPLPIVSS